MGREQFRVNGGPLEGSIYALDMRNDEEVTFKIDGQTHVYKAYINYETGYGPERYLQYVGVDPTA